MVAPLFAIMLLFILVASGAAIDISRTVNAREKLAAAIDAAALSVAADLSRTDMEVEEVQERLSDLIAANLADVHFTEEAIQNMTFAVEEDTSQISVASSISINTFFIHLTGYEGKLTGPGALAVNSASLVEYSDIALEIALIVDVTASMSDEDMLALRDASMAFLDKLIPESATGRARVRISWVPYAEGVFYYGGPGGGLMLPFRGFDVHGAPTYPDYCLTERKNYGSNEVKYTDEPYDYFQESTPAPISTFFGGSTHYGVTCGGLLPMYPLTSDRDALEARISGITGGGAGRTAIHTGLIWGWNTLSPVFGQTAWPAQNRADAYNDDRITKIAVVMTDGATNTYFDWCHTSTDGLNTEICDDTIADDDPNYTHHWRTKSSDSTSDTSEAMTRTRRYCQEMKDQGIELYSVMYGNDDITGDGLVDQLDQDISAAANSVMQDCASPGNFHQAVSTSDLVKTFADIANQILPVYLAR